jgi:uncharacterized protein YndB with AHSA1/START domain
MKSTYTATAHIPIKANAERVWEALTDPELIRQYLFGTRVHSENNWASVLKTIKGLLEN